MNRRNFIKTFSAVAASVPIASALANTKGVEPIIETFQLSDIESEVGYTQEFQNNLPTNSWENIRAIQKGEYNGEYEAIFDDPILVLAKNRSRFLDFIRQYRPDKFKNIAQLRYVNDYMNILGYRRGMKVIGLANYWEHENINKIMKHIYVRDMVILNPDRYFEELMI